MNPQPIKKTPAVHKTFILLLIIGLYFLLQNPVDSPIFITVAFVGVFFVALFFIFGMIKGFGNNRSMFLQGVALSLGLSFKENNDDGFVKIGGTFWDYGLKNQIKISNILYGTRDGFDLKIFDTLVSDDVGRVIRLFTAFEVEYKTDMPHLCITSKELLSGDYREGSFSPNFNLNGEPLTFEGNFSTYFTVEVEKGFEQEAYEILTPDIMAFLIDEGRFNSFEFLKDKMYLLPGRPLDTGDKFVRLFNIFDSLKEKLHLDRSVYFVSKS